MGAFYETIPQSLFDWILAQKIFWVATAPLSPTGHVNISPKGGAYFGLLPDARTFWYLDLTGSGSETIAHLYERGNGRITVLFNAFSGPPRILRIFGHGRVLEKGAAGGAAGGGGFNEFVKAHGLRSEQVDVPGARAIVVVDVHQVGTSCGYSVPFFEYREHRNTLNEFFARKEGKFREGNEAESMPRYWALKNSWSMDGMPAMDIAQKTMREEKIKPLKKMVGPMAPTRHYQYGVRRTFGVEHLVLVAVMTAIMTAILMNSGASPSWLVRALPPPLDYRT